MPWTHGSKPIAFTKNAEVSPPYLICTMQKGRVNQAFAIERRLNYSNDSQTTFNIVSPRETSKLSYPVLYSCRPFLPSLTEPTVEGFHVFEKERVKRLKLSEEEQKKRMKAVGKIPNLSHLNTILYRSFVAIGFLTSVFSTGASHHNLLYFAAPDPTILTLLLELKKCPHIFILHWSVDVESLPKDPAVADLTTKDKLDIFAFPCLSASHDKASNSACIHIQTERER